MTKPRMEIGDLKERAVPNTCSVCGSTVGVSPEQFSMAKTPNWVWLALPLGIFPAAILAIAVQARHTLWAPFCGKCIDRYRNGWVVSLAAAAGTIALLFGGAYYGLLYRSWLLFGVAVSVAVLVAIISGRYAQRISPKFSVFTKHRVVLLMPDDRSFTLIGHAPAEETVAPGAI